MPRDIITPALCLWIPAAAKRQKRPLTPKQLAYMRMKLDEPGFAKKVSDHLAWVAKTEAAAEKEVAQVKAAMAKHPLKAKKRNKRR